MEDKKHVVGAYRRVLGEERQHRPKASGHARQKEQQQVDAPQALPFPNPYPCGDAHHEQKEQGRLQRRRIGRLFLSRIGGNDEDLFGVGH